MIFAKKETTVLNIEGMMCEHCAKKVTTALKSVKGVKKVIPNVDAKTVTVVHTEISTATLITAIETAGYKVV